MIFTLATPSVTFALYESFPTVTLTTPVASSGNATPITASSPTLILSTAISIVEANLVTLNLALSSLAKYLSSPLNLATTS